MSDQTPESFIDPESSARLNEGPSGDMLGNEHMAEPEQYELADAEAEELTAPPVPDATPDKADPDDMVIDDPQELADAEAVAADARSTRPVRRNAPVKRTRPAIMAEPTLEQPSPTGSGSVEPSPTESTPVGESASGEAKALVSAPGRRPGAPVRRAPTSPAVGSELPIEQQPKGRPTRPQNQAVAEKVRGGRKRTSPSAFINQSVDELRKVIWPTQSQLSRYFVVVLAFVLFIIAFVGLLDLFFGWALLKLFGK